MLTCLESMPQLTPTTDTDFGVQDSGFRGTPWSLGAMFPALAPLIAARRCWAMTFPYTFLRGQCPVPTSISRGPASTSSSQTPRLPQFYTYKKSLHTRIQYSITYIHTHTFIVQYDTVYTVRYKIGYYTHIVRDPCTWLLGSLHAWVNSPLDTVHPTRAGQAMADSLGFHAVSYRIEMRMRRDARL